MTNGLSAMGSAKENNSPIVVLGGRAPALRWGQGSLQEIDHVPIVRPLAKLAATAQSTAEIPSLVDEAFAAAMTPHTGPVFLDFPLDQVFMESDVDDVDALLLAAVVDREDVAAREREQLRHAVGLQALGDQAAAAARCAAV